MNKTRITRNAIECRHCGKVIESRHRHDFVAHECKAADGREVWIAADGGKAYLRRLGARGDYIERSEMETGDEGTES